MKKTNLLILAAFSITCLTSCASNISSDNYVSRNVGEASTTYAGTIRSVREVCVDESNRLSGNQSGAVGGGAAGGLVGNALGGGLLPTAAGAVVGAVGGSFIEKKLKQQSALEYVVQLEDGGLMTVVQGLDNPFCVGQPVYVIVSQFGRSRVVSQ